MPSSPCSGRVAILGVWILRGMRTSKPRLSANPPARPGPAAVQGVQAGPGTLRHPNLDKIFTKWVAIKDLDAA